MCAPLVVEDDAIEGAINPDAQRHLRLVLAGLGRLAFLEAVVSCSSLIFHKTSSLSDQNVIW